MGLELETVMAWRVCAYRLESKRWFRDSFYGQPGRNDLGCRPWVRYIAVQEPVDDGENKEVHRALLRGSKSEKLVVPEVQYEADGA